MAEAVKFLYIQDVNADGNACTNVLSFTEEHIMQITPQFVPNYYPGVDVKQDHKWWVLTIVVDSETDIFDLLFLVTTGVSAFTTLFVDFILADGQATLERWTYQAAASFLMNRNQGKTDMGADRNTTEYQILVYGTRRITRP